MNKLNEITKSQLRNDIPDFGPGDTIDVNVRVIEGGKERNQHYRGIVLARKGGSGISATFTVRKISGSVGVERIFPLHSPMLKSVKIVRRGKVRRAKLNYIRKLTGSKATRIAEKR